MRVEHHRRGEGEPLLLLHGIGSRWQAFAPVLDRLAAERDVIAADLPGFGGSEPLPAGTAPTPAALARAIENDGLRWPRRDGLKWPHFASVVLVG